MMEDLPLHELPHKTKVSLAKLLDRPGVPNWRSLVSLLPTNTYKKPHVEAFAMETLKLTGSPTISLINDLGNKGKLVHDLIGWLEILSTQGDNAKEALELLIMQDPPCVLTQPESLKLNIGQTAVLQVSMKGSKPLLYQWFKENVLLPEKEQNQLILKDVSTADCGYYICRVANSYGFVFSNWAKVEATQRQEHPRDDGAHADIYENDVNSNINKLIITVQPVSLTLFHGETKQLYCDAVGNPAPTFQWYKDSVCVAGGTDRELVITRAGINDEGSYFCKVCNEHGTTVSHKIDVTVLKDHGDDRTDHGDDRTDHGDDRKHDHDAGQNEEGRIHSRGLQPPFAQFSVDEDRETATDKIALLIGNKDYWHAEQLGSLYHPTNDVRDVAGILQSIGFKVVSLIDLCLHEMQQALKQFCNLLDTGMYAVFYFAGHGFEINGVSYLMPVDATDDYDPAHSMPAGHVLNVMQHRNTKLSVLLLDCCRTTPASVSSNPLPSLSGALDVKQGNVLIAFGCCSQGRVFESANERNGFFANHLVKYLGRDQLIEHVLFKVAKGIDKDHIVDPSSMRIQRVYRHSSLAKHISLCDPLDPAGHKLSTLLWQQAHEIPEESVVAYDVDGFKVELSFLAEFSNSLIISSKVTPGDVYDFVVKFRMPEEIDGCAVSDVSGHNGFLNSIPVKYDTVNPAIKITSLQRLENDLEIVLFVTYTTEQREVRETVRYILEKPLYAKVIDQLNLT